VAHTSLLQLGAENDDDDLDALITKANKTFKKVEETSKVGGTAALEMPVIQKGANGQLTIMQIGWYSKLGKIMQAAQKAAQTFPGDREAFAKYYDFCYKREDLVLAGTKKNSTKKESMSISLPIDLLINMATASGAAGAKFVADVKANLNLAQDLLNGTMATSDNFA